MKGYSNKITNNPNVDNNDKVHSHNKEEGRLTKNMVMYRKCGEIGAKAIKGDRKGQQTQDHDVEVVVILVVL